jgi:hypothetical protein
MIRESRARPMVLARMGDVAKSRKVKYYLGVSHASAFPIRSLCKLFGDCDAGDR